MKKLFTAVVLFIALAGAAFAQASSKEKARIKIAVVEFSPSANASGMTVEAKRQLQANLASALVKSDRFNVVDVRWTRNESQNNLAAINGESSTAAAVRLGKLLGALYVVTGSVTEYTPKGADDFGRVVLKTRLVEVATGKVKYATETTQRSTSEMRTTNPAEVHTKMMKPAIDKLTAAIAGLKF